MQILEPEVLLKQIFQVQPWSVRQEECAILTQNQGSLNNSAWFVPWNKYSIQERKNLLEQIVPQWVGFHTSGHTGKPLLWFRRRQQLLAEILLLNKLCYEDTIDGIITFAPIHHIYGCLCSVLLPLLMGVPVWFQPIEHPTFITRSDLAHPLYIAIPATLTYLEHELSVLRTYQHITIVHSTAQLSPIGNNLVEKLFPRLRLIELFGSTETGLVATRVQPEAQDEYWRLANDVTFASLPEDLSQEVPLAIESPRIAWSQEGESFTSWKLDDFVFVVDKRTFKFEGRRNHLVKVNGRRIHLGYIEEILRGVLPCTDLACVIVPDTVRGENFDVMVVPNECTPSLASVKRISADALAQYIQPRKVHMVQIIPRSATGKLIYNEERL
jgi:acyl-coenzyme A synthetase/AMP-(fatty) acid ligase